jgi:hypothetical protein
MKNKAEKVLWIAVKVQRGYISEAKVYRTCGAARRAERRWRTRINPDYDEVGVVQSRLNRV